MSLRRSACAFQADAVVLTTGTFLSGLIHVGLENYKAGRAGDPPPSVGRQLRELKLPAGRLKTGTPPRLDGRTIDFSVLADAAGRRSCAGVFVHGRRAAPEAAAVLDHAHQRRTHDIIRAGLDRSPMYRA